MHVSGNNPRYPSNWQNQLFHIALYVAIYSHITAFDNDLKYNFCNTFGK